MTTAIDILEVIASETSRGRKREPMRKMGFHKIKLRWTRWTPTSLSNGQARFDDAKIRLIRADVASGMKRTAVALKHGIGYDYLRQLVKRERRA